MLDKESVIAKFDDFKQALLSIDDVLQQEYNVYIRDSAILRFEFCFELAWKTLKLIIEYEDKPVVPATPRSIIERAVELRIIGSESIWYAMLKYRNLAVHTYNADLADSIFSYMEDFQRAFHDFKNDATKILN